MDGDLIVALAALLSGIGSLFVGVAAIRMAKKGEASIQATVGHAGGPRPGGDGGGAGSDGGQRQQPAGPGADDDDHGQ
jgi:hypothetical protein